MINLRSIRYFSRKFRAVDTRPDQPFVSPAPPLPEPGKFLIDLIAPREPAPARQATDAPAQIPTPGDVLADIDFSRNGNSEAWRLNGWSHDEDGFVWSVGDSSELAWRIAAGARDVTLEMDVFACLVPPWRTVQRLFVRRDDRVLARADVTGEGKICLALPDDALATAPRSLTLYHPDGIIPWEADGRPDVRCLSFAFRRIVIRGHAAAAQPVFSDAHMMEAFESLGGSAQGCEFGLVQRKLGAEPLSLLRWTHMTAESLAHALESRFEGVGNPAQTILDYFDWPTHQEYRTQDRLYVMKMHTWVKKDDKPYDEMFQVACKRLVFLRRKLLDDLAAAEKIFVFKMGDHSCTDAEIARIHRALRAYGPNTLLHVRVADADHPAGTVEVIDEGLLVGRVAHFNTLPDLTVRPADMENWRAICRAAHALRFEARMLTRNAA